MVNHGKSMFLPKSGRGFTSTPATPYGHVVGRFGSCLILEIKNQHPAVLGASSGLVTHSHLSQCTKVTISLRIRKSLPRKRARKRVATPGLTLLTVLWCLGLLDSLIFLGWNPCSQSHDTKPFGSFGVPCFWDTNPRGVVLPSKSSSP